VTAAQVDHQDIVNLSLVVYFRMGRCRPDLLGPKLLTTPDIGVDVVVVFTVSLLSAELNPSFDSSTYKPHTIVYHNHRDREIRPSYLKISTSKIHTKMMGVQDTITPATLRKGDTIAFISPSSRVNTLFSRRIQKATSFFQTHGFKIKVFYNETLPSDHLAAIQLRCSELHSAFSDPDVKAILCTRGGLSANELLPHLDYELIRKNPKIFCGYSDITILHHALFTQCGLRTFYGPAVIPELGEASGPIDITAEHFFEMVMHGVEEQSIPQSATHTMEFKNWLSEEEDDTPRTLIPAPHWKWLKPGKMQGKLFGGCLPSLVQLCGTKYLADYNGRILPLELPEGDKPGTPFSLDAARSAMADLRNAGVLEKVAGMVIGRPYMYDDKMTTAFERMMVDQTYGLEIPMLASVDTGHSDPMLTLPLDAMVALDSEAEEHEQFVVLEKVVKTR
jgi:muramoyltetrapeptide carboxypeptidase